MLGLDNRTWIADAATSRTGTVDPKSPGTSRSDGINDYWTYFGLGHALRLIDEPGVFAVSPAGLSLGSLLVRWLDTVQWGTRALEMGTGSGVLSLLLRSIGVTDITATDISATAVELAPRNELLNFDDRRITFAAGDLFEPIAAGERFDLTLFNPPGWRSPSTDLISRLEDLNTGADLDINAMFYGDSVVLRFLTELPNYLTPGGRAIVGLNSMMGIRDVLGRYRESFDATPPLRFRLLERHAIPMLFYSESWRRIEPILVEEFTTWSTRFGSAFTRHDDGTIYWSYEIIECKIAEHL